MKSYNSEVRLLTATLLPWVIENKKVCSYGDISDMAEKNSGKRIDPWRPGWGKELGELQDICQELDLPCLSVMAVTKDSLLPSAGFYVKYDELHPEDVDLENSIKRQQAIADVLACPDWGRLFEYLEIEPSKTRSSLTNEEKNRVYYEGQRRAQTRITNEISRNPDARRRCLEAYGTTCQICGFSSLETYGIEGVIHVHHILPLAECKAQYETNPETDLIPVCPNCHAVLHSKPNGGCYTPEEVKQMIKTSI